MVGVLAIFTSIMNVSMGMQRKSKLRDEDENVAAMVVALKPQMQGLLLYVDPHFIFRICFGISIFFSKGFFLLLAINQMLCPTKSSNEGMT